jgi:hypothetical protein
VVSRTQDGPGIGHALNSGLEVLTLLGGCAIELDQVFGGVVRPRLDPIRDGEEDGSAAHEWIDESSHQRWSGGGDRLQLLGLPAWPLQERD